MEFKILKKSKKSRARIGIIKTRHGILHTPAFLPVATQACIKTLDSRDIKEIGFEGILCNTYHLMLRPGSSLIRERGGLHKFMNFQGVIATDSGGFQVFSLGKGLEQGVGKIAKGTGKGRGYPRPFPVPEQKKPSLVKIREEGVWFRSHIDGKEHFSSPEESMKIQQALGADIIFAFDECTSPLDSFSYTKKAMERTHRWAIRCLESLGRATSSGRRMSENTSEKQGLFGIVQGGLYKKLREKSASFIGSLPFDGFGIGGSLGVEIDKAKKKMFEILDWVIPLLPEEKPKHLLGIGYLEDFEESIKKGVDLFDCCYPTRIARHGVALTSEGVLNISKSRFLKEKFPLDKNCACFVCQNYSRSYISHLFRAKEITGMRLLTEHNLCFFKNFMESIRKKIAKDKI